MLENRRDPPTADDRTRQPAHGPDGRGFGQPGARPFTLDIVAEHTSRSWTPAEAAPTELRTFLIADVRGYTRYTQEHGDEAASALAARFAGIVRDVVPAFGGELVELRGDEALCVFGSARQAIRTAVELQRRLRIPGRVGEVFPLGVGAGLDAGEAVPTEGGYRGAALNLAARLCAIAKGGETLASESAAHLAGRVDGVRFNDRRPVRLKGMNKPVRFVELEPEVPLPPVPAPPPRVHRRRLSQVLSGVTLLVLLAVAGAAAVVWRSDRSSPPPIVAIPNSVVAVDPRTTTIVTSIPVGDTPTDIVAGAGYVWELNSTNLTVSRINARTRTLDGSPFSVGVRPEALAAESDALWIADADRNSILEVDPETETPIGDPVDLNPGGGTEKAPGSVSALAFGLNHIYALASVGLARVDPGSRHVELRRGGIYEGNPYGPPLQKAIAAGREGLWVETYNGIVHLDPNDLKTIGTVPGPNPPRGITTGEGWVWVADAGENTVWRISPTFDALDQTFKVGAGPAGVVVGGGFVWSATTDGTITRIDPNGNRRKTLLIGATPTSITYGYGLLWIAVA
jgi:class 3 adenylate cyclase/streptogramin lyase